MKILLEKTLNEVVSTFYHMTRAAPLKGTTRRISQKEKRKIVVAMKRKGVARLVKRDKAAEYWEFAEKFDPKLERDVRRTARAFRRRFYGAAETLWEDFTSPK